MAKINFKSKKAKLAISTVLVAIVTGVGTYNGWDVSGILNALKNLGAVI